MLKNKELSLEDIAQDLPILREKLERLLAGYVDSLERVSQMPVEFSCRWRASWVEEHLEKTRDGYQDMLARCIMVGFVGGMMISAVVMATGQPMRAPGKPSTSPLLSIAIRPSGEIKPVLTAEAPKQTGAIVVTFEEYEHAALKLRQDVLSGKLVPSDEGETGQLLYDRLAQGYTEN